MQDRGAGAPGTFGYIGRANQLFWPRAPRDCRMSPGLGGEPIRLNQETRQVLIAERLDEASKRKIGIALAKARCNPVYRNFPAIKGR
jgi:hypothetical protein